MITINCVVVGDPGVGKTSLFACQTSNIFTQEYKRTIFFECFDTLLSDYKKKQVELNLWDTAGEDGENGLRPLSNLGIDVCFICFSVISPDSFENVSWKWHKYVQKFYPNATLILVGTKLDLFRNKEELSKLKALKKLQKTYTDGKELAMKMGAIEYFECSALTGNGVQIIFEKATHEVLKNKYSLSKSCVKGIFTKFTSKTKVILQ